MDSKERQQIIEQEKKQATEDFNNMPFEYREIACNDMIHDHILHLKQSRSVTIKNHKRHLREIDDHIKNLERSILENARKRK